MARKVYPNGKALIDNFINTIGDYKGFEVVKKCSYCQFIFDDKEYYVYFKCITHEGNPYPLEHQRAQLPFREEFNDIKDSLIPFLFIGYDVDNDVYVCWEPHKIKPRLNKKKYVSFYSRLSAQQSVMEGKIKNEILTNGDKFVLLKRTDIIPFLQMIDIHFPELASNKDNATIEEPEYAEPKTGGKELQGRILDVKEDDSVKILIDSFSEETSILTIIGSCMNEFGYFYDRMQFSDWGRIVRKYINEKSNEE